MARQIVSESKEKKSSWDGLKWSLIFLLIVGAVVANIYYAQLPWAIRTGVGVLVALLLLGIASRTRSGQKAWEFMKGARSELRKVVWPTRHETVQTTLVVVAMVVVTALILWGLDSFFMWAVAWMTGQRG